MALADNALVTLDQAKAWLGLNLGTQDELVEDAINAASQLAEAWCNRPLKKRAYADLRFRGLSPCRLYTPAIPIDVTALVTVAVNGTEQTVWRAEADGDPADFDVMVASDTPEMGDGLASHLWRAGGWCSTSTANPYNVRLSYTGGFDPVPADLAEGVLYVVQKLFRDRTKQIADVTSITGPSGSVQILDTVIPRVAQRLLERYRRILVG